MSSAPDRVWILHNLFFDPPGTPKELKCVECKLAAGAASLALAGASLFGTFKTFRRNVYYGLAFGAATAGFTLAAAITFRLAHDYRTLNETLIRNNALATKQKRKEFKEANNLPV